jgi:hypothetical protein
VVLEMKYEKIVHLKTEEFRRLTGVKKSTFDRMVEILKEAEIIKKAYGGKPNKLHVEDRLLMTLEYLREYRTYFHIAKNYGISESACQRNVRWIEDTLISHKDFALPGKKELTKSDVKYEIVLIDASESPIERPKKSKNNFTQVRKKDIH